MKVFLIPGFLGYKEDKHFLDLQYKLEEAAELKNIQIKTIPLDWNCAPVDPEYSLSSSLEYFRKVLIKEDPNEVVLIGFSLGGVAAGVLASEFPIKKLGLIASPYKFATSDDMLPILPDWQKTGKHTFPSSKYGEATVNYDFVVDAQKYDLLNYIPKVTCPIFIVAGSEDTSVPAANSHKIFEVAHEPKKWILVEGMEHKYKNQGELIGEVNALIAKEILET